MKIDLIKLLLDAGMFVLIWIVQLVIYPSFNYYTESNLVKWHSSYTSRFTIIVLPLMVGQLLIYIYGMIDGLRLMDAIIFALIIVNWGVTFFSAVPLHNKIQKANNTRHYRERLISINWLRTIAWTLIFIISLITNYAE